MLPYLYYGVLLPFVFYGLPVIIIFLLFHHLYIKKLPPGARKVFFLSWKGKALIGFVALIVVLIIYGLLVYHSL